MALAKVTSASAPAASVRNRIKKTSAVLRKLSLNAAKNWHQNSGAKRRERIRGGIAPLLQSSAGDRLRAHKKNGRPGGRPSSRSRQHYLKSGLLAIRGIHSEGHQAQARSNHEG